MNDAIRSSSIARWRHVVLAEVYLQPPVLGLITESEVVLHQVWNVIHRIIHDVIHYFVHHVTEPLAVVDDIIQLSVPTNSDGGSYPVVYFDWSRTIHHGVHHLL